MLAKLGVVKQSLDVFHALITRTIWIKNVDKNVVNFLTHEMKINDSFVQNRLEEIP